MLTANLPYAGMVIEFKMASLSCVAFWKTEAEFAMSALALTGGPRGGNSGCCRVGVTAFEAEFELLPERRPDEELEPELRDLSRRAPVFVRVTIRLEGGGALSAAIALVNVRV
jgi:hypothetical protein